MDEKPVKEARVDAPGHVVPRQVDSANVAAFHWEGDTPKFRNYDISKVPVEARPAGDRVHHGHHGYTVFALNGAVFWRF